MRKQFVLLCICILLLGLASGCVQKDPILIGFSSTLTGDKSEIGIALRDGLMLKVEEINAAGGINGRMVEVLIEDDQNDLAMVEAIDQGFVDKGVHAIFGHELSSKASTIIKATAGKETIVISPTISTYDLSGSDDHFFRTITSNYDQGKAIAGYASDIHRTLIVYDNVNKTFADGVIIGFTDNTSHPTDTLAIDGEIEREASKMVDQLETADYDSIIFVTNPHDTVFLNQVLFKEKFDLQRFSSNWGMAINSLKEGGQAVEGLVFVSLLDQLETDSYKAFAAQFETRYKQEPPFASIYSYESALVLFAALEKTETLTYDDIKESLLSLGEIEGLMGSFRLDQYGDVEREPFMTIVEKGELRFIE